MRNKVKASEHWITVMARYNNLPFPQRDWEKVKIQLDVHNQEPMPQYSFIDMLCTPQLRKRSLILFYL
jgi:hypothetical protein